MSRFDLSNPPHIKLAHHKSPEIYLRYFPNHQIDVDNSISVNLSNPAFAFIVTI